jgi:hypothetical protein
MQRFQHDQIEIAYLDEGEGDPIVLIHGFASTAAINWVHPGWVTTLTKARRRVIALDNRGHGASSKPYDPAAYHSATMAEDVRALLDHLGVARADVMGYSRALGSRLSRARIPIGCVPSSWAFSAVVDGAGLPIRPGRSKASLGSLRSAGPGVSRLC